VWAGACAGELLERRGGLEWSDLDYLRSALDGKSGALERQPTKHVRTHTHKLKPLNHITVVPHPLSPLRFNTCRMLLTDVPTRWSSTYTAMARLYTCYLRLIEFFSVPMWEGARRRGS